MENEVQILVEAAEQLEALKVTLAEQQGLSTTLRGLTESVGNVASQVSMIPDALKLVVTKAEEVGKKIIEAGGKVDALKDGIPSVIERIERSDVGRSIDALTADISGSRDDLMKFRESVRDVENVVDQFRSANDAVISRLLLELEQSRALQEKVDTSVTALSSALIPRLEVMEKLVANTALEVRESAETTCKIMASAIGLLKGINENQATSFKAIEKRLDMLTRQEMSQVHQELEVIVDQIKRQGESIIALSKKKGFSF
ncbi:hypothetical protein [Undibacterium sp. WLX3042]|uniref:hypothetical protein n=1 Tax=Undibacterium sp. WLX3042 TaxID=3412686 RepID=UPI003C2DC40C